jgi:hypothetical protein
MVAMKSRLLVALLSASLLAALQARAKTILPDACGDDSVKFDVSTQKSQPPPAPPVDGKAQIVFIETLDGCFGCGTPTSRFGMDGAWVGANKGSSYFTMDIAPGEHHLCTDWQSVFGKLKQKVGLTSFTAEAGKVYYYEAKVTMIAHQYGFGPNSSREVDKDLVFGQLSDDEGKYRVKASAVAASKPSK